MDKRCDLLIRGGRVFDGSGRPGMVMDLAVKDGCIAAAGAVGDWAAADTVDAAGLAVAPGFIDTHTHDDMALLRQPAHPSKVTQGVTTVVIGNCGASPAPLGPRDDLVEPPFTFLGESEGRRFKTYADYADALEAAGPDVHVVKLVGHSNLRAAAMKEPHGQPTEDEMAAMKAHLEEAMAAGCVGFSVGLAYPTGKPAPTAELIELAAVAAARGGLYATHMRDEADHVVRSVEESLEIGAKAGVPVLISHHKCCGPDNWGRSVDTLARVDAAAEAGQRVFMDAYPYTASSTGLMPEMAARAERVLVTESVPHPDLANRDLAEIMAEWDCDMETAVGRLSPAKAVYFQMSDDDLERILAHPLCMVGSDGMPSDAHPHPRLWGTFPRVLGHYARDRKLFDLAQAIRKLTQLPAQCFGLTDRGAIAPGKIADLVIFDADEVIDRATYEMPERVSEGIRMVITGGEARYESR
ncbi:MAG: D-aminoacylase [Magnetovibrio sp.]|nr:D-aminoacylase [Magnetovibrio sp.]